MCSLPHVGTNYRTVLCTNIERCKVREWSIYSEALPSKWRTCVCNLDTGTQPNYHFLLLTVTKSLAQILISYHQYSYLNDV